ncbi:hypothetical protein BAGQ_0913 [Bacillus velezensis]|nr:hypothetical protein BCBMB205_08390 [Bacillus velezensis]ARZ57168.1 hypothetical protein BAGQ_0913 [Bacillus velezensis]
MTAKGCFFLQKKRPAHSRSLTVCVIVCLKLSCALAGAN